MGQATLSQAQAALLSAAIEDGFAYLLETLAGLDDLSMDQCGDRPWRSPPSGSEA